MSKILKKILILTLLSPLSLTFAASDNWAGYWDSPTEILDTVVGEANKNDQFQETALDGINSDQWGYQEEYQISNTLDYLRMHVATYLQWLVYMGLTIAVMLLIYNGFLMVTNTVTKAWDMTKVKKNIQYIAIGVIILTSFYAIIRLIIGLINSVFGTNGSWDTGF